MRYKEESDEWIGFFVGYLEDAICDTGLSNAKFAKSVGLTKQALSQIMLKKDNLSMARAAEITKAISEKYPAAGLYCIYRDFWFSYIYEMEKVQ